MLEKKIIPLENRNLLNNDSINLVKNKIDNKILFLKEEKDNLSKEKSNNVIKLSQNDIKIKLYNDEKNNIERRLSSITNDMKVILTNRKNEIINDIELRQLENGKINEMQNDLNNRINNIDEEIKKMKQLKKEGNIQQRGKERGPNAKIDLFVELADLYNGITRTIEFEKNVICKKCHGTGGKLGKTKQCPVCNGRGVMMRTITMGIGMQMQMQQPCERCGAKGVIFSENCPYCQGRKIVREKKKIEIVIEKGMENNQNLVFRGEAEQLPDRLPGDLIMQIKQKPHEFFKERKGNDLYADMELNLKEALFGYNKKITHMDGREFYIESNKVTQPEEERVITGEGMPVHKFPSQKGDLHIRFHVVLPKTLNKKEKELIREIFVE